MLANKENFKILSALRKTSKPYGKVESKKVHSFQIRVRGSMQYCFEDKTILVSEGEMIFLPKGSCYKYEKVSDEDTVVTIINLEGDFGNIGSSRYSIKDFYDVNNTMYHFADMWKFGNQSQRYQCLSLLYSLLAYVSNLDSLEYQEKRNFI